MSTVIENPTFDWFGRYKLALHTAWVTYAEIQAWVLEYFGEEKFKEIDGQLRERTMRPVAEKLVEKLGLKPDIEGALKLVGAYTREIWGYGDPRFVGVIKESSNKGTLTISVCRGWEKWDKGAGINCEHGCPHEYYAVLSALSPDFEVTLTKALPRGDNCCEFVIEAKSEIN